MHPNPDPIPDTCSNDVHVLNIGIVTLWLRSGEAYFPSKAPLMILFSLSLTSHLEQGNWYEPLVMGERPSPRSGYDYAA